MKTKKLTNLLLSTALTLTGISSSVYPVVTTLVSAEEQDPSTTTDPVTWLAEAVSKLEVANEANWVITLPEDLNISDLTSETSFYASDQTTLVASIYNPEHTAGQAQLLFYYPVDFIGSSESGNVAFTGTLRYQVVPANNTKKSLTVENIDFIWGGSGSNIDLCITQLANSTVSLNNCSFAGAPIGFALNSNPTNVTVNISNSSFDTCVAVSYQTNNNDGTGENAVNFGENTTINGPYAAETWTIPADGLSGISDWDKDTNDGFYKTVEDIDANTKIPKSNVSLGPVVTNVNELYEAVNSASSGSTIYIQAGEPYQISDVNGRGMLTIPNLVNLVGVSKGGELPVIQGAVEFGTNGRQLTTSGQPLSITGIQFTYDPNVVQNSLVWTYFDDEAILNVENCTFEGGSHGIQVTGNSTNKSVNISGSVFNTWLGISIKDVDKYSLSMDSSNEINGEFAVQLWGQSSSYGAGGTYYSDASEEGPTGETFKQYFPNGIFVTDISYLDLALNTINGYPNPGATIILPATTVDAENISNNSLINVGKIMSPRNGNTLIEGEITFVATSENPLTIQGLVFPDPVFVTGNAEQITENDTYNDVSFIACIFTGLATITNIEVTPGTWATGFSPETYTYVINVGQSSSATLSVTCDYNYTVSLNGTELSMNEEGQYLLSPLAVGNNSVVVSTDNGSLLEDTEYILTLVRETFTSDNNGNTGNVGDSGSTDNPTKPTLPNTEPVTNTTANKENFEMNSGINAGVEGTGAGFTSVGSQTQTVDNSQITYTQNENGTKAASTQAGTSSEVSSSVITVPSAAIIGGKADISLGINTNTNQSLTIPGNKTTEATAPSLTVNLPTSSTKATVNITLTSGTGLPGTVAMIEDANGKLTPIPKTSLDGDVLSIPLTGSQKIVIMNNSHTFSDAASMPAYASTSAAFVSARGLMTGMGTNAVKPFDANGVTTRGQFATIVWRLEGEPASTGSYPAGITPGAWNANAARWAVQQGLMAVGSDFAPQDYVTREQIAMILWRLAGSPAADTSVLEKYSDADLISSSEMKKAMAWNIENKIIGVGSKLDPTADSTRGEMAAMLERYIEKI